MVAQTVLSAPVARRIVRKSGFRPGASTTTTSGGAGGGPILTLPSTSLSALEPGTYFYPYDLEHYITLWDSSYTTHVSISVPVIAATSGATLYAVWGSTHEQVTSGAWEYLTDGIALTSAGFYVSEWAEFPSEAQAAEEVYVGCVLEVESTVDTLSTGIVDVRIRDANVGEGGGTLTFGTDPPYLLVFEGGQYYADWSIAPGNHGYTDSEAGDLIQGWLHHASGWSQAGITFRRVSGAAVTFNIQPGMATFATLYADHADVTIGYDRITIGRGLNVTSHEAGHAFFRARHAGTGVMSGGSPDGYPTADDIASVIAWLAS